MGCKRRCQFHTCGSRGPVLRQLLALILVSICRQLHRHCRKLTDAIVHRLIDRRLHPASLLANVVNFCDFPCSKVTEAQVHKLALLVHFIHGSQSFLEWYRTVGCMEIEDVNSLRSQLRQTLLNVLPQSIRLVDTRLVWIDLGSQSEAAILPFRIACPGFLLAANVHARSVHFIITLRLEVIEMLGELIEVCDAGPRSLIGTLFR